MSCSSRLPVVRTEVRTIPKLEFVPVPAIATEPCLVPMPPLDSADGTLDPADAAKYLAVVLGILEECNIKLKEVRELDNDDKE